jgi:beta-glucosidase
VRTGVVDDPPTGTPGAVVTSAEHSALARDAAAEGITLLKNTHDALPFGSDVQSIFVFLDGPTLTTGSGSAEVASSFVTDPFNGIKNHSPSLSLTGVPASADLDAIESAAAAADAVVMVFGVPSGEGGDRLSLSLSDSQNAEIARAVATNPRTVVVLDTPGAVLMPWLADAAAVLVGWYPGEENGNALASVLFGDVNPSGKLPVTFPADATTLPVPVSASSVDYSEGLDVGYRTFDASGLEPAFEFGFGLSYTTFSYDRLELSAGSSEGSLDVGFTLTNTGARTGTEVSQVDLSFPADASEPPRVLRGFERTELAPGESRHVHIELPARAFACWDPAAHGRYAPGGSYTVSVGGSSRQLPLAAAFDVVGLR